MAAGRGIEVWSGGQTGVDRAALDCARDLGLATGGWVPAGRLAEDDRIPNEYRGLRETATADYAERTILNVRDTHATLVLRWGEPGGGTLFTIETARRLGRPLLDLDLAQLPAEDAAGRIRTWLAGLPRPLRLNVAGPRASQVPVAFAGTREVLRRALE